MSVKHLGPNAYYIAERNMLVTPKKQDILGAKPTMAVLDRLYRGANTDIVYWGADNNFPHTIREQAYKNPIIPRAIMFHANMVASATVLPVMKDFDDNGTPIHKLVRDPDIWNYLDSTQHRRYMLESASDLYWFQNIFPDVIISRDRKSLTISPNESMFCRWASQNEQGLCTELIHNANWPYATRSHQYSTIIPTIDPYAYDIAETVRERTSTFKFAYPASYPSPGAVFYQTAFWDGIRQSKYLEFLAQIPEVKNQIMKNKIKPSYHVQLPMMHWERWFGKAWYDADHDGRRRLKNEYLVALEEILTAKETAGAAFVTEYGSSSTDNRNAEKWEITQIDDKTTDGTHNQDNIDGTVQLLCALGIYGSLIGYSSKESGTRNGGSDKVQALQNYIVSMKPFNEIVLEPLRFKAKFDGWTQKYPRFDFVFRYPELDAMTNKAQTAPKEEATPKIVQ
jgi:hypothetical protein